MYDTLGAPNEKAELDGLDGRAELAELLFGLGGQAGKGETHERGTDTTKK